MSKTTRSKPGWEAARRPTTSGTGGTERAGSWRNGSVWNPLRSSGGAAVLVDPGGRAPVVGVAVAVAGIVVTVVTGGAVVVDVRPSDTVPDRWSAPQAAR